MLSVKDAHFLCDKRGNMKLSKKQQDLVLLLRPSVSRNMVEQIRVGGASHSW